MAESIVSLLIEKLATFLSQEYTLLEGIRSEVQYVKDELESMSAFLRVAEAKIDADIWNDEQKAWFKQVLEVAHETEAVVDEFSLRYFHPTRAGFRGHVGGMYTSVKNVRSRHQISSKIGDIKRRMVEISARHRRYRSNDDQGNIIIPGTIPRKTCEHPMRGHALLLQEADLVGIDLPKSHIITRVLANESPHQLKAISVVGMGGLGKTTLVKRVFEDPEVKSAFSLHAWLTISETFLFGDAFKNLITQLCKDVQQRIPSELDSMDGDGLREFVRNFLRDKRYIIVLDDLWELHDWHSIKLAFPDDLRGSCILITTRKTDVANTCCHEFHGNIHKMQPLSSNESWDLFCKRTFGDGRCPPHLEDISRRVLKKCKGLPLGIVTIGGLLALKDTNKLDEWETVLCNLGGELEARRLLDPVRKILLLSYNDLPYHLKSCLLYMGMFSEDEIVDTRQLALLWIAEGFVVEMRSRMTTLEVAQSYLNELIGRSLVHVVDTELDGRIRSCRVHDLIYNIILTKCKELNIPTTASTPNIMNARRLVVDEPSSPRVNHVHFSHLRSLIRNRKSLFSPSSSSLSKFLKGAPKLLKALHFEDSHLNIIPKGLFELSNLTYLNLSNTNISDIPSGIRKLQNLEYLLLEGTRVKELPADIIMLNKLCYIGVRAKNLNIDGDLPFSGFKAPYGFGGMLSLQYLEYIEADSKRIIQEIGKLTELRQLGITKVTSENGRELGSSLEKLTNLKRLCIQAITRNETLDVGHSFSSTLHFLHDLSFVGHLKTVPEWVFSCHGLSTLTLDSSLLRDDPLWSFDGFPNLVALFLHNAYIGDTLNFKAEGFQKLKHLELVDLLGLQSVRLEIGTLPDLQTFCIKRCILLEEAPHNIQYLSKLRTMYLEGMPEEMENSFRTLEKEIDEMTHIIIGKMINGNLEIDHIWW